MNLELKSKLETLALSRSIPFCYSCYKDAPTGTCLGCGSDDCMRHLPGVGVEYGLEWVMKSIVESECSAIDVTEWFDNYLREVYPDTVSIGWLNGIDPVMAMEQLDPIAFDIAKSEWLDQEVEEERLITLDNGSTYYAADELEGLG